MNIHTVRDNLKNTIAGKENYLLAIQQERTFVGLRDGESLALETTAKFLAINIDELKRLLTDVETCCEQDKARSWEGSVDRMSGAFDESELRGRDGWL